jgi:acyl-coenzyme A synthetase/AMP-(fatty) acid ligase
VFTILDRVRHHASTTPEAPALIALDLTLSFAELEATTSAVATRLRELGVAPRQIVVTDLPAAEDWIISLALLRLGTRSLSAQGVTVPAEVGVDVHIGRPGGRVSTAATTIQVDRFWIEQVASDAGDAPDPTPTVIYPRVDSVCRVILTSGTTGTPRAVELSIGAIEHRLSHLQHYWTDGRRELTLMALSTTGGLHTALASMAHGTPYVAVDAIDAKSLRRAGDADVEVLCGSPVQIGSALRVMREHELSLPSIREIRIAGDSPSPRLLAAIEAELAVPVRAVYGSTEGGGVTTRMLLPGDDPADVGAPVPGVDLQIVDDASQPVAPGVIGFVRYRGGGLANGYVAPGDDTSFRRGWFWPGDLGQLDERGHLLLAGRSSEVINLGGVKVDPAAVDRLAETFAGVREAAAFSIERVPGIIELGLAVVAEPGCDMKALDTMLRAALVGRHPTVFGQVSVLPRNRMGKVERARLTAEFRRRLSLD